MRQTTEEYFKFGRGLKSYVAKINSPNASTLVPLEANSETKLQRQQLTEIKTKTETRKKEKANTKTLAFKTLQDAL
jgi:hypothetical protein